MTPLDKTGIARRAARDLRDGWAVNLGIGVPELVANHVPDGVEIILHSENGILGMGPQATGDLVDPAMINAGKKPITALPGASIFDHATSFGLVRSGRLDLCLLGAYQVAANGDLANWSRSFDDPLPAIGGAMDLAAGARRVRVLMQHQQGGAPRLLERCSYPLTCPGRVERVYTDLAVIDVIDCRFVVREMIPGLGLDELAARTGAPLDPAVDLCALA